MPDSTAQTSDRAGATRLVLRQPDDWHVHLRDGEMLAEVVQATARQFARAIVMPNLAPPVTSVAAAADYRERILAALPPESSFTPLMTAYLTDASDAQEIERGFAEGVFTACKLYPERATTNSEHGVTDVRHVRGVFATMERIGMPLLLHGEVTDREVDVFDREAAFIERVLTPLIAEFPDLKIVFEHITTEEAVQFVQAQGARVAATITPHHLVMNRNAMFDGGLRPHSYCLPVAKREQHRLALRRAATSGSSKFFLGTDSAPHRASDKESACGCAGVFNAPVALETYAGVFDEEDALHNLEGFASINGPRFYGLPVNEGAVLLQRSSWRVSEPSGSDEARIVPYQAGATLEWQFAGQVEHTFEAAPPA